MTAFEPFPDPFAAPTAPEPAYAPVDRRATWGVREIVIERGLLSDEEVDRALDVLGMTEGGVRK